MMVMMILKMIWVTMDNPTTVRIVYLKEAYCYQTWASVYYRWKMATLVVEGLKSLHDFEVVEAKMDYEMHLMCDFGPPIKTVEIIRVIQNSN